MSQPACAPTLANQVEGGWSRPLSETPEFWRVLPQVPLCFGGAEEFEHFPTSGGATSPVEVKGWIPWPLVICSPQGCALARARGVSKQRLPLSSACDDTLALLYGVASSDHDISLGCMWDRRVNVG